LSGPRFAFLIHPLTQAQLMMTGARRLRFDLAFGHVARADASVLCELGLGDVKGVVVSVPRLPWDLLEDQDDALRAMTQAVDVAEQSQGPLHAVGLGSLLAVVAGRGTSLGQQVEPLVTTGNAATAWSALHNVLEAGRLLKVRRAALLGFGGTVGGVLAQALVEAGWDLVVGGTGKALERRAKKLGVPLLPEDQAARGQRLVVGAATTGGTLDPSALDPDTWVLDVALPPTLKEGPRPRGVRVLSAEAVALPQGWRRDGWGAIYPYFAGYGPRQVFACLIEPMVLAALGGTEPWAQGRRLKVERVHAFGEAARSLGFRPRLAEGWRPARLG
jgi:predicted amino acid dehydrogenase